ncbi:hypothetical protein F0562_032217 [Nyssa sinensis]|uniref:Uncharacterized protein n=1 Tax=Nyssa sinensis TaxID=561372 RepID=A0A5J5AWP9_9ASTE|nr:hypothetical protein F0562_032217 [Nyssa sinensis]
MAQLKPSPPELHPHMFLHHIGWVVGTGDTIQFWHHPWHGAEVSGRKVVGAEERGVAAKRVVHAAGVRGGGSLSTDKGQSGLPMVGRHVSIPRKVDKFQNSKKFHDARVIRWAGWWLDVRPNLVQRKEPNVRVRCQMINQLHSRAHNKFLALGKVGPDKGGDPSIVAQRGDKAHFSENSPSEAAVTSDASQRLADEDKRHEETLT